VIFGVNSLWDATRELDNTVDAAVQTRIRLHSRRLVERATRWLLNNRRQPLDIAGTIQVFTEGVAKVAEHLPKLLRGVDLEWYQSIHDEMTGAGLPGAVASRVAGLSSSFPGLYIVEAAERSGKDVLEVAEVYYDLADRLHLAELLNGIGSLPRSDRWQSMARASIREDLFAAHAALAQDVLACGPDGAGPEQRYKAWEERNTALINRARSTLADIRGVDGFDLANLSVAMRVIRSLLRTAELG
jgi:glutamate dehydrogenase